MSRKSGVGRRFLRDQSGVVTVDWVAVTATFVVVGIVIVYSIFGDNDEGLISIINSQQGQLADRADDVTDMLSDVESWSPGGS